MERVVGIGGTFLRARDPDALLAWYAEHLGIEPTPWGGAVRLGDRPGGKPIRAVGAAVGVGFRA